MNRKLKLTLCLVVAALALTLYAWFFRLPFFHVAPENAIPRHTGLIFFGEKTAFSNAMKEGKGAALQQLFLPKEVAADLVAFEKNFGKILPLAKDAPLIAVVQPSRTTGMDALFILDNFQKTDLEAALKTVPKATLTRSVFKSRDVVTVELEGAQFSFSQFRNLLLVSRYAYLVENAISQIKSPSDCLCRDGEFRRFSKKIKTAAEPLHAIVHLRQLGAQFAPLLQPAKIAGVEGLGRLGNWLDFRFPLSEKSNAWQCALSPVSGNPLVYAALQGKVLPFKNAFRALPDNLASIAWLSVRSLDAAGAHQVWRKYFSDWAGDEIAFATGETLAKDTVEQFVLLKTTEAKTAETCLEKWQKKAGALENYQHQMFTVQQFLGNEASEMFGLGNGLANPYAAVLGEYVLFSNSKAGLERWLDKYLAGQTLSKSAGFLQSIRSLPAEANGFFYLQSEKGWQQLSAFLDDKFAASLSGNPLRFSHAAATMLFNGNVCEFSLVAPQGSPVEVAEETPPANILWKTPLAAEVILAPAIFQNPATGELEIFTQDATSTACLISRSGRVLWRRKLDAPIQSKVFSIDLDDSGEGQFAFSTARQIFVLDHAGNDADGFPLSLETPASNGVTVIDFFKSHDYRFFIACENGNAYGFDERGSPVEGWRPQEDAGVVRQPIVHFQEGGKDYLVLLDSAGTMRVLQKNGTPRFSKKEFKAEFAQAPDYQINQSAPRIVACDVSGKIHVTNLAGDDFKLALKAGGTARVKFAFADVCGDERKDYIALGGNALAVHFYEGNAFKKSFDYSFQHPQDEAFAVPWKGDKKAYIGTVSKSKKQIFLLDGGGKLNARFPLAGTSAFTLADLGGDGKPVAVVAFGESVYAYLLE